MQTRKEFLGIAGLGALTLGTLAIGCLTNITNNYANSTDFSEFTRYLGNEWDSLPQDKQKETRDYWNKATEEDKEGVLSIYQHPQNNYNSLDKDVRENIDAVLKYQTSGKKIRDNQKYKDVLELSAKIPWINLDNLTKRDLVYLGTIGEATAYGSMMAQ